MPQDLSNIKLLLLDVDGVLTDGSILIDDNGVETKRFNVKDGLGINAWKKVGKQIGIITARSGSAVTHRTKELGIDLIVQGAKQKIDSYTKMLSVLSLTDDQVAYIGDDLPDLKVMQRVAYPIAPADAATEILQIAKHITQAPGGRGAVRQAVEHILRSTGQWNKVLEHY